MKYKQEKSKDDKHEKYDKKKKKGGMSHISPKRISEYGKKKK